MVWNTWHDDFIEYVKWRTSSWRKNPEAIQKNPRQKVVRSWSLNFVSHRQCFKSHAEALWEERSSLFWILVRRGSTFQYFPVYYSYQPRCALPSATGKIDPLELHGSKPSRIVSAWQRTSDKAQRSYKYATHGSGRQSLGMLWLPFDYQASFHLKVLMGGRIWSSRKRRRHWRNAPVLEEVIGDKGRRRVWFPWFVDISS
jgi:hypothetical protein